MADFIADRLQQVLAAAGPAHHAAYIETDGFDPEWPLWYAGHLVEHAREILGRPDLTVSRLVWALVAADDAYVASDPDEAWPSFYARRFVEEFNA